MILIPGFIFFVVILYALWMKKQNQSKSKWGINFEAIKHGSEITCAGCGAKVPKIRKPQNLKEILWGGFTCKSCGKQHDKWFK